MKKEQITLEKALFILAFLLGVGIRFLRLGAAPLSDFEAHWALQALAVSRGEEVATGPQPGYVFLTGLTFFIFGSGNAWARLWPALAGGLLVGVPYFFRRTIGSTAALVTTFGLALDPGLVAVSRLAGGPMWTIGFSFAALSLWHTHRPVAAGILIGLALLGGPALLHGALGILLTLGIMWVFTRLGVLDGFGGDSRFTGSRSYQRIGVFAGLATLFVVGTLFFRYPQGVGALAGSLSAYLASWLDGSQVSPFRLMTALTVYQPLALIFGLVSAVRGWVRNLNLSRLLSLWTLVSLSLILIYPDRQVIDLAWVLLPLWVLSGLEVARNLQMEEGQRLLALGQAALVAILLVLAWINLSSLPLSGFDTQIYRVRWALIGGVIILISVTTGLVALGWSSVIAQRGLTWGLGWTLGIYVIANLWSVSQLHPNGAKEIIPPPPATQQADLLMTTLGDLAEFKTGHRDTLDLVVTAQKPSIHWVLRDWKGVDTTDTVAVGELPSAVITTGEDDSPRFSAAYRGQDFAWSAYPAWQGALPHNWPGWLAFREAPQRTERVILWVRGDIFPGGSLVDTHENEESSKDQAPIEEDLIDSPAE